MSQSTFCHLRIVVKLKSRSVMCCFSVESRSFLEAPSIVLSNQDLISSLMRILKNLGFGANPLLGSNHRLLPAVYLPDFTPHPGVKSDLPRPQHGPEAHQQPGVWPACLVCLALSQC